MSLMYINRGEVGSAVNLPANIFDNFVQSGLCYSGLRVGADGNLYERHPTGGWSRFGTWLFTGTSDGYYLSRSIVSGTLSTDAGAGPLQLNVNRDYDVQIANGEKIATIQFDISSDVSGTPIVATAIYVFFANSGLN